MKFFVPLGVDPIDYVTDTFIKHRCADWCDRYAKYTQSATSYEDAVKRACGCTDGQGHFCRNQSRITKKVLAECEQKLLETKPTSWEHAVQILTFKGSGDVNSHFIATRICRYLKLPIPLILTSRSQAGMDYLKEIGRYDEVMKKVEFTGNIGVEDYLCQVHQWRRKGSFIMTSLE